jgi:hypothetical protein
MNKYEEVMLSIIILLLLILVNVKLLLSSSPPVSSQDVLGIYLSIQESYLVGDLSNYNLDYSNVYILVLLDGRIVFEYGDNSIVDGEADLIMPIYLNGSIGEFRCWMGGEA